MILMVVSRVWVGSLGFLDEYMKVFGKEKEGVDGKFKMMGEVGVGVIVGVGV